MAGAEELHRVSLDEVASGSPDASRNKRAALTVEEIVARKREGSRQWVALLIVGSLFMIVILSFVSLWISKQPISATDIVELVDKLLSPVVGIVGAVTGFYFGERRAKAAEVAD